MPEFPLFSRGVRSGMASSALLGKRDYVMTEIFSFSNRPYFTELMQASVWLSINLSLRHDVGGKYGR